VVLGGDAGGSPDSGSASAGMASLRERPSDASHGAPLKAERVPRGVPRRRTRSSRKRNVRRGAGGGRVPRRSGAGVGRSAPATSGTADQPEAARQLPDDRELRRRDRRPFPRAGASPSPLPWVEGVLLPHLAPLVIGRPAHVPAGRLGVVELVPSVREFGGHRRAMVRLRARWFDPVCAGPVRDGATGGASCPQSVRTGQGVPGGLEYRAASRREGGSVPCVSFGSSSSVPR
jgi:hypothetical protein